MTAFRRSARAAGTLAILLALSGCFVLPDQSGPAAPTTVSPDDPQNEDAEVAPSVEAVIVVAGVDVDGKNVTVSGYVAGILEDGGECSYEFTGQSGEFSATAVGTADRSVTTCGTTQVEIGQFTKGPWEVTLSYTTVLGDVTSSEPLTLEIP